MRDTLQIIMGIITPIFILVIILIFIFIMKSKLTKIKKVLIILSFILFCIILISYTFITGFERGRMPKREEYYYFGEMPNKKTEFDTIYTKNVTDNTKLITYLKSKLETAKFTFEELKSRRGLSFNNCEENRIKIIEGDGIREYFARSKKPEKGSKDYYPDFYIEVYEFPTDEIAEQNYKIFEKALNSAGRFCNGKSPEKLIINGNEVFHLGTRAEMFRTYTEKYGEMIKNFR